MRFFILFIMLSLLFAFGCIDPPPISDNQSVNMTDNTSDNQTVCAGPVCGIDGNTYQTDCIAKAANITVAYDKECVVVESCLDNDDTNSEIKSTVTKGDESYTDYCLNNNQVAEYVCVENEISLTNIPCNIGYMCLDGACISDPNYVPNNTVTKLCLGPTEVNISITSNVTFGGNTYTDSCIDYTVAKRYYCKNDKMESTNRPCDSGYFCNFGRCEKKQPKCSENDGGRDEIKKGKTTVLLGTLITSENFDSCVDIATLKEFYCFSNGTSTSEDIDCGTGFKCFDGRCVSSFCNDSDGGKNIYKVGVAVGKDDEEYEDRCDDLHHIIEYFCFGDDVTSDTISCGVGYFCDEDHCVEGSIS